MKHCSILFARFLREGKALMSLLAFFAALISAPFPSAGAETTLAGLRGGKVLILVEPGTVADLTVTLAPVYGWAEAVTLFGPDARVLQRLDTSRTLSTTETIRLSSPGLHVLHLKRSYMAEVNVSGAKTAFQPLLYQTSLRLPHTTRTYFTVPSGTDAFTAAFNNRVGLRASDGVAEIQGPDGFRARMARDGWSHSDLTNGVTVDPEIATYFTPDEEPDEFVPSTQRVSDPAPGVWSVDLLGNDVAFWLEGVPNRLAIRPTDLFTLEDPAPVAVRATIGMTALRPPILGSVGHLGPPGNARERQILDHGVSADKIFLHQRGDPETDRFSHPERLAPRADVFSLVVMRSVSDTLMGWPLAAAFEAAGKWAGTELAAVHRETGRPMDTLALQVLNEPNLGWNGARYRDLDDYLVALDAFIDGLEATDIGESVPLAAPALGSVSSETLIDWPWIEAVLDHQDAAIDVIVWNMYEIFELEDTNLYAEGLHRTRELIRTHDTDGQEEEIIIGATNRVGGLSDAGLFDGRIAGVWWSSVIANVANTGLAKALYYFQTLDTGPLRDKGLFRSDWSAKPQAMVMQAMGTAMRGATLRAVHTDHPMVEGVFAVNGAQRTLFLINKGWLPVSVSLDGIDLADVAVLDPVLNLADRTDAPLSGPPWVLPPQSIYQGAR
ncbi:hypothetical protein [Rhodospira trueperi]|uniref:Glycosyl hydrolases family 39 n=1 Tax=Rhodospira trueperi TaxID=69960 RepID=A0A1G7BXU3_9PROT|nr:hypothetical protein [Rhodospira trueperi]SDE31877.1 hypothetical protein SAMN05421720_105220 [Rhodospira trueperi]